MSNNKPMCFLRKRGVIERTGLSGATIYRLERAGDFPKRRQLSEGTVGWVESEVDLWIEERERRFAPVSEVAQQKQVTKIKNPAKSDGNPKSRNERTDVSGGSDPPVIKAA